MTAGPQSFDGSGNLPGMGMDALNGFSWRDLDSLGQYISNDASIHTTDGVLTTPDFDSEQSTTAVDALPVDFAYQSMWNGGDIIF